MRGCYLWHLRWRFRRLCVCESCDDKCTLKRERMDLFTWGSIMIDGLEMGFWKLDLDSVCCDVTLVFSSETHVFVY